MALVDEQDYDTLSAYRWHPSKGGNTTYARTTIRAGDRQRSILMHRLLLSVERETTVDHVDGDGLNNTRANLRRCTHAENLRNQALRIGPKSSRFKGVNYRRSERLWRAEIEKDGRRVSLGLFKDEVAAARRYDAAARLLFGKFARTNVDLGLLDPVERAENERLRLRRIATMMMDRRAAQESPSP